MSVRHTLVVSVTLAQMRLLYDAYLEASVGELDELADRLRLEVDLASRSERRLVLGADKEAADAYAGRRGR